MKHAVQYSTVDVRTLQNPNRYLQRPRPNFKPKQLNCFFLWNIDSYGDEIYGSVLLGDNPTHQV